MIFKEEPLPDASLRGFPSASGPPFGSDMDFSPPRPPYPSYPHEDPAYLIPGLGRSPGEGKGYPLQYSGLKNSMDCIVHGVTESRIRLSDSLSFGASLVVQWGYFYRSGLCVDPRLSPEINPCTYGYLIFDKGGENIQWRKDSLFK